MSADRRGQRLSDYSVGSYPEPMSSHAPPAITYPSEILWALQQEPEDFEREARTFLALKLFEQGRLSSGLAAKLAGVPRLAFLFLLGQHGLSPVGVEPDELAEDLAHARRAGCSEQHFPHNPSQQASGT